MTKVKLQAPLVHMNGTSKESLLEAIEDAYLAIGEAMDKMRAATPNMRDYYPLVAGAFESARAQHVSRCRRLESVRAELEVLATAIPDGETTVEVEVESRNV